MSIKAQADLLGFEIVGRLTRYPDGDLSRYHYCFVDEGKNVYIIHLGVLTIMSADGRVL